MKHLALLALVVCCVAMSVSAQLAFYVDEQGRRIYINAAPKPEPAAQKRVAQVSNLRRAALKPAPLSAPVPASPVPAAPLPAPPVPVDTLIQQTADRHSVDPNLVRAMVKVESNFNPNAVSHKGALGLMQLIPSTARQLGVINVFNAQENLDGGVRYLKQLMGIFGGDVSLSLAAYNAGPNAVARHGGVPPYAETQNYVKKISELYVPFQNDKISRSGIIKYLDENGRTHFTNVP